MNIYFSRTFYKSKILLINKNKNIYCAKFGLIQKAGEYPPRQIINSLKKIVT